MVVAGQWEEENFLSLFLSTDKHLDDIHTKLDWRIHSRNYNTVNRSKMNAVTWKYKVNRWEKFS